MVTNFEQIDAYNDQEFMLKPWYYGLLLIIIEVAAFLGHLEQLQNYRTKLSWYTQYVADTSSKTFVTSSSFLTFRTFCVEKENKVIFLYLRGHSNNTWHSRGVDSAKCHMNFFCFLNSDLKAFRSKKSYLREQD